MVSFGSACAGAKFPEIGITGALDSLLDRSRAAIVGRDREIPVAEFVIQIVQMVGGGAGGFFRIEPLVGIWRLLQAIFVAAKFHELPHAFGGGAGNRARHETRIRPAPDESIPAERLLRPESREIIALIFACALPARLQSSCARGR